MGVARQVGEDGLRSGERSLGVDDPLGAAQRREGGVEGALVGERGEVAEEGEASGGMQGREPFEKEAAEQAGEHPHGQEEAGLAGDPRREPSSAEPTAAGNDDVDVRMVGQRRAPGTVPPGGEADARAEMLRVRGDRGQRLGGGPEQEVVDGRLVLERDGADRGRQGEDDVDGAGTRQKLRLAVFEPLPRGGRLALGAVRDSGRVVMPTRSCAQSSQRSTWPPSAAMRRSRSPTSPSTGRGSHRSQRWPSRPCPAVGAKTSATSEGRPRHAAVVRRAASAESG